MKIASHSTSSNTPLFEGQHALQAVLEGMYDGVLICSWTGLVLWMNKTLRKQLPKPDQLLNLPLGEVIPSEDLQALVEEAVAQKSSQAQELQLSLGKVFKFFQIHALPLPLSEKNTEENCMILVFHDTTEIRQTERMRRDFVANVSHELRTPLSAIKGYAETLLDGALEDPAVSHDFVSVIFRHAQRLSQLVEDLLDLSKLESPDFKPELKPLVIDTLIERVRSLMVDKATEKDIVLSVQPATEGPLTVMADELGLEQVLTNLMDNAIKYTPAEGRVTVSMFTRPNHQIQVNVTDTGFGIDSKYIPRLFERFYRVDKARSRDMGGTGLGLSIVKHIIQLHGGDIWVESTPGIGSTFSFSLQLALPS